MSHETKTQPAKHGTAASYTIGFILSLIFTLIPYYLVRNNEGRNSFLLLVILELAVVQLIIQVVYFLHLGRKPQPRWELWFFLATIATVLVVVGGSLVIVNNLHSNMSVEDQKAKLINDEAIYQINGELTGACQTTHSNHRIVISNGAVSPRHTITTICDTLTFINNDTQNHTITFGVYPAHDAYAGESELDLRRGKTKTITLSAIGGYNFHDHQQPNVAGSFLVTDDGRGQ